MNAAQSENGVALIIVLLLLAVMSGLVTGMTMNGHVEIAMAANEISYAGARAAAEAGMNRAIEQILDDTTTNLLAGPDGAVDAANAAASVNADNGSIAFLIGSAGPYALGTSGQYTYSIRIFDDDDPALYPSALTAAQLTAMGEDGSAYTSANDRLILRSTGFGPSGTTVRVSRVLESVDNVSTSTTTTTTLSNPAILVNGDLVVTGNIGVSGLSANVHANGDMAISGNSAAVDGAATAVGTFTANNNWHAGGAQGGGRPTVNVPNINALDYLSHADYILKADGTKTLPNGAVCGAPCSQWTMSGGMWRITGNSANDGTFFSYAPVHISGSPGSAKAPKSLSVIATGSIEISGSPYFKPENSAKLQFVTDGDLTISGNVDADDVTSVEGQILVREQIKISGNPDIQGQIIAQNVPSVSTAVTDNTISGHAHVLYNGSFGAISTTTTTTTTGPPTYVNNVSGWLES